MAKSRAPRSTDWVIANYSRDIGFRTFVACRTVLALDNIVEINVLVMTIFKRYDHLYFWILPIALWGVILYALGYFFSFLKLANICSCVAISRLGW